LLKIFLRDSGALCHELVNDNQPVVAIRIAAKPTRLARWFGTSTTGDTQALFDSPEIAVRRQGRK
jgi:hypothetical protein